MHAAVDGLMLEYRRAALFYGAGYGRLALALSLCLGYAAQAVRHMLSSRGWLTATRRRVGRMSMFFLSLIIFAWLVFDWHAAVPMMIAMCFGAYGAPIPSRTGGTRTAHPRPNARATPPGTPAARPRPNARKTCKGPVLTHRRSLERRHVPLRAAIDRQVSSAGRRDGDGKVRR